MTSLTSPACMSVARAATCKQHHLNTNPLCCLYKHDDGSQGKEGRKFGPFQLRVLRDRVWRHVRPAPCTVRGERDVVGYGEPSRARHGVGVTRSILTGWTLVRVLRAASPRFALKGHFFHLFARVPTWEK